MTRLVTPVLFLALVGSFALPFLTVTAIERKASATGLELVSGSGSFTGTYTHAAYEGEVEAVVENARIPAILVLVSGFIGFVATFLRGRNPLRVGFAVALAACLAYLALFQVTAPRFSPPEADHRVGFWLAGALAVAALAWTVVRLIREPSEEVSEKPPDLVPPWLR